MSIARHDERVTGATRSSRLFLMSKCMG